MLFSSPDLGRRDSSTVAPSWQQRGRLCGALLLDVLWPGREESARLQEEQAYHLRRGGQGDMGLTFPHPSMDTC